MPQPAPTTLSAPLALPHIAAPAAAPATAAPPRAAVATPEAAVAPAEPLPVTVAEPADTDIDPRKDAMAPSLLQGPTTADSAAQPAADAALPDAAPLAVAATAVSEPPSPPAAALRWVEHTVAKGESLARIFAAHALEPALLHRIVSSDSLGRKLAQIRPGQTLRFQFDDDDELSRLELHRNRVDSLRVAIADDDIRIEEISRDVETRIGSASGIIESSLFVDGQNAGMSDRQIMELAEIFGWDIDFALEIRAGDRFRVLYEEHFLDGEKLRDGPILAAEFTNRGTTHTAVRYEDKHGEIGYYDAGGASKRRAFIRSPIKFARISSRYNPRRWHPILKKWRSHKGVDYAAPKGTPIRATGDGRVVFRGRKSGYGKTVIIEHAGKYTTLYAHMNGYSKRSAKGKRVKQGQVIGYVGKTGLATGPHLHYEFRVNGRHRDPLRVKLPKSMSLAKSELANFREQTTPLLTQLAAIPSPTMVASAETTLDN